MSSFDICLYFSIVANKTVLLIPHERVIGYGYSHCQILASAKKQLFSYY